jgi:HK97 family phage prohead protease
MSDQTSPQRDTVIRAFTPPVEFRSSDDLNDDLGQGYIGLLRIRFSPVNEWTEINSAWEGRFMERFAPGAWKKTIKERATKIRALFQHGQDPQIGDKPLGPFHRLEEDEGGGYAEVKLLDTTYNRDLIPGLKDGLYGASHRFGAVRAIEEERPERSEHNPHGIKEVTITEARLHELGPVTFGAYEGATSGMRSMTDEFILSCFRSDPDRLREMFARATDLAKPPASEQQDPAPSEQDDAAPTGTSTPERRDTPSKGRYGLSQHPPRPSWAL